MLRPIVLVLIFLLVSFTCIIVGVDEWEDQEARWKFMHKAVCLKRPMYGKCRGHREMWYFDMFKLKCSQFTYSNCGGNTNRFYTKAECDDFCTEKSKDWIKQTK